MPSDRLVATLRRLPLWLHRLGIRGYERVLGVDWLVLTTRGRRTLGPRTVVLDVIGRDAARDVWYVQPADGRRSHWFQNLLAHPEATVEVHGRRFEAHGTEVTGDEGAEIILRFLRTHPLYGRLVVWLVGYVDDVGVPDEELRIKLEDVPLIALRRCRARPEPSPP